MSTKEIKALNIGDTLYRYVSMGGVFTYTVIGIRQYERGQNQYEVRCETCTHGWKCELLIAHNDRGDLVYVSMLNNDEEDNQAYWHKRINEHEFFFVDSKEQAQKDGYLYHKNSLAKELKKQKDAVAATEKRIAELDDLLGLAGAKL